ncbi:mannan endo-1,4-beta-mannosidase [Alteromonadaceae bacterium 2753L.S.0a.02]|nr:mannan endo-1,4-beta-mannosidase [Alteromonadaceae bacterium 2753L.S.0a.02]
MNTSLLLTALRLWLLGLMATAALTGCIGKSDLNTEEANYQPETRPLDVIAGSGGEFAIGSLVTVQGRLVGSASNGESIIWEQTAGTPITVDDWTASPLSFTAPQVDGIESFTFVISGLDRDGEILQRTLVDSEGNSSTEPMQAEVTITVFDPDKVVRFEVEDDSLVTLDSLVLTSEGQDQYISGAVGSHTRDFTPGASVTYSLDTTQLDNLEPGYYSLYVRYAIPASGYGEKGTVVTVNGVPFEFMIPATGTWENYRVGVVSFDEGINTVEIGGGWNYYRVDSIAIIPAAPPAKPLAVAPTLVNPEAIAEAQSLMEFLTGNYGEYTLSGQTEFVNYNNGPLELTEFNKVVDATGGDSPAIVAFDFMDFSSSRVACGATPGTLSEDMITEHQNRNVILSALWHWNAPMHLVDSDCSSDVSGEAWWHGFYTSATSFDLAAALADENSPEYEALVTDIDAIAAELQKFEDAGIPILWRPLHEAEGGWFWWGNAGPEALKALWILLFERLTVAHDLDNLIWVYTFASDLSADWYPGDAYVDIVGYDGYDGNNRDNPFSAQFATLKNRYNGKKLVALTETGTIPDVAAMHDANAWWSFFITWNSDGDQYGPDGAAPADIAASYAFDGVLNLDNLPGGRTKFGPGIYDNFEISVGSWHSQINWSTTPGTKASNSWASSGLYSLAISKDLSQETSVDSLVFQDYPAGGIDVSAATSLTLTARTANAGSTATAKLFVKHGDDWVWVDSGAQAANGEVTLQIDVSAYDWLAGLGVQFENLDGSATAAEFYLDAVALDGEVIADFEPSAEGWQSQINWSNVSGTSVSSSWASDGNRALSLTKDLSAVSGDTPNSVIFQTYPSEGFDVSEITSLTLDVNTMNSGANTTAKLFVKFGDDWTWADSGAEAAVGGSTLTINVSAYDWLAGLGVQFENFDASANAAAFYLDNVRFDGNLATSFEGTGAWDFQVNWASVPGIHLATQWRSDGDLALAGTTQLAAGDNDIILQTYPADGILLDGVATLSLQAFGEAGFAKLWAKDKAGTWRDGGSVAMSNDGVALSLDISDLSELQGFGVQFTEPTNTATPASFYIDAVTFEAAPGD